MVDFYKFLADYQIKFERHDHPQVFTVEDANRLVPPCRQQRQKIFSSVITKANDTPKRLKTG